jgi:uncharacterized protein (TIGR02118 family)
MIRVMVAYPNRPGSRFDLDYYMKKHIPMVEEKMAPHGLTGWTVSKGLGGLTPGTPAPYVVHAHLDFQSLEGLQAGLAVEGAAIMGDIPNYTDLQPEIQVNEVVG